MKAKILILSLILATSFFSANAQSNLFDKLSDNKQITTVFVSKVLLSMVPNMEIDANGVDIKKLFNKLEQLEIYTSSEKEGIQLMKSVTDAIKGNKKYEVLMKIKDGGHDVNFYALKGKDFFKELVMCVEGDDCVIMRLTGTFTQEDIQQVVDMGNKK